MRTEEWPSPSAGLRDANRRILTNVSVGQPTSEGSIDDHEVRELWTRDGLKLGEPDVVPDRIGHGELYPGDRLRGKIKIIAYPDEASFGSCPTWRLVPSLNNNVPA